MFIRNAKEGDNVQIYPVIVFVMPRFHRFVDVTMHSNEADD